MKTIMMKHAACSSYPNNIGLQAVSAKISNCSLLSIGLKSIICRNRRGAQAREDLACSIQSSRYS